MAGTRDVHLVTLIHGLWGTLSSLHYSPALQTDTPSFPGSPAHLVVAKQELEDAYRQAHAGPSKHRGTTSSGPSDDPVVTSRVEGRDEELVVVIAGGMTSQLTYDGVDVCASRVAWEVSPFPCVDVDVGPEWIKDD